MTTLRNANLDVFIQCQYTRTILRNKNMGQSPFTKHSRFPKFDEILHVKLDVFKQKLFWKIKIWDRIFFRNFSKLQDFQLSNFTLTCSSNGKMNSVRLDMTYSKELQQKNENDKQTYLEKQLNYIILVKCCVMAISSNSNRFLMGIERSLSHKGIIKVYENIPIQL